MKDNKHLMSMVESYSQRSRVGDADFRIDGTSLMIAGIWRRQSAGFETRVDLTAISMEVERLSKRPYAMAVVPGTLGVAALLVALLQPLGLLTALCGGGAFGLVLAAYHSCLPIEYVAFKDKAGATAFQIVKGTNQHAEFEAFVASLLETIRSVQGDQRADSKRGPGGATNPA